MDYFDEEWNDSDDSYDRQELEFALYSQIHFDRVPDQVDSTQSKLKTNAAPVSYQTPSKKIFCLGLEELEASKKNNCQEKKTVINSFEETSPVSLQVACKTNERSTSNSTSKFLSISVDRSPNSTPLEQKKNEKKGKSRAEKQSCSKRDLWGLCYSGSSKKLNKIGASGTNIQSEGQNEIQLGEKVSKIKALFQNEKEKVNKKNKSLGSTPHLFMITNANHESESSSDGSDEGARSELRTDQKGSRGFLSRLEDYIRVPTSVSSLTKKESLTKFEAAVKPRLPPVRIRHTARLNVHYGQESDTNTDYSDSEAGSVQSTPEKPVKKRRKAIKDSEKVGPVDFPPVTIKQKKTSFVKPEKIDSVEIGDDNVNLEIRERNSREEEIIPLNIKSEARDQSVVEEPEFLEISLKNEYCERAVLEEEDKEIRSNEDENIILMDDGREENIERSLLGEFVELGFNAEYAEKNMPVVDEVVSVNMETEHFDESVTEGELTVIKGDDTLIKGRGDVKSKFIVDKSRNSLPKEKDVISNKAGKGKEESQVGQDIIWMDIVKEENTEESLLTQGVTQFKTHEISEINANDSDRTNDDSEDSSEDYAELDCDIADTMTKSKLDFNIEGGMGSLLKQPMVELSKDDGKWQINDQDRYKVTTIQNRYFSEKKIQCRNCREEGHLSRDCPKPLQKRCLLCAEIGHTYQGCPQSVCHNCQAPGHRFKDCTKPKQNRRNLCDRCWMPGHHHTVCPDHWRQYHLTLSGDLVQGYSDPSSNPLVYCYNCGRKGHLGFECEEERMTKFVIPTYPFIAEYDCHSYKSHRDISGRDEKGKTKNKRQKENKKRKREGELELQNAYEPDEKRRKKQKEKEKLIDLQKIPRKSGFSEASFQGKCKKLSSYGFKNESMSSGGKDKTKDSSVGSKHKLISEKLNGRSSSDLSREDLQQYSLTFNPQQHKSPSGIKDKASGEKNKSKSKSQKLKPKTLPNLPIETLFRPSGGESLSKISQAKHQSLSRYSKESPNLNHFDGEGQSLDEKVNLSGREHKQPSPTSSKDRSQSYLPNESFPIIDEPKILPDRPKMYSSNFNLTTVNSQKSSQNERSDLPDEALNATQKENSISDCVECKSSSKQKSKHEQSLKDKSLNKSSLLHDKLSNRPHKRNGSKRDCSKLQSCNFEHKSSPMAKSTGDFSSHFKAQFYPQKDNFKSVDSDTNELAEYLQQKSSSSKRSQFQQLNAAPHSSLPNVKSKSDNSKRESLFKISRPGSLSSQRRFKIQNSKHVSTLLQSRNEDFTFTSHFMDCTGGNNEDQCSSQSQNSRGWSSNPHNLTSGRRSNSHTIHGGHIADPLSNIYIPEESFRDSQTHYVMQDAASHSSLDFGPRSGHHHGFDQQWGTSWGKKKKKDKKSDIPGKLENKNSKKKQKVAKDKEEQNNRKTSSEKRGRKARKKVQQEAKSSPTKQPKPSSDTSVLKSTEFQSLKHSTSWPTLHKSTKHKVPNPNVSGFQSNNTLFWISKKPNWRQWKKPPSFNELKTLEHV